MIILVLKVCHVHCSTLLIIISDKELPVGQQSQSQSDLSKSITIHNQQSVLDRQSHSILSSAGKILSTDNCIQRCKRDLLSFHKIFKCITGFLLKQNRLSHCAMCVLWLCNISKAYLLHNTTSITQNPESVTKCEIWNYKLNQSSNVDT